MENELPSILVTGASGFIGRNFLDSIKESYEIFAIARRSQKEANVPDHINIRWFQCDISNRFSLREITEYLKLRRGVDFIFHMAAYYDFDNKDQVEYQRTNIDGTKYLLEIAREIEIKRFFFISSIAACDFPESGKAITEKTPAGISQPYAKSKMIGEQYVKEYSNIFPCTIIRLTAVFSDWCEYAPLYKFLNRWLSKSWDSRILGGKGESAVPYIFINDVVSLFNILLEKNEYLPRFDVYIGSPDGSSSHLELFKIATHDFFGHSLKPVLLPRLLTYFGIYQREILRKLDLGYINSFERIWMLKYIDLKLNIDSSYTRKTLNWHPLQRYHISRRMLYILEKMKSHPMEWRLRNEAAYKKTAKRPGFLIAETMLKEKERLLEWIIIEIRFSEGKNKFINYKKMDFSDFKNCMSTLFHLLVSAARSGDRSLILKYIDQIAIRRFSEGFEPPEICEALNVFNNVIISNLSAVKDLQSIKDEIYFNVGMTIQLAQDEIEDLYASLDQNIPKYKLADSVLLPDSRALQKLVKQLNAIYQRFPDEKHSIDEKN